MNYHHYAALAAELKIMSNLRPHVNVLSIVGAYTAVEKRQLFLLTEYCDGGSLLDYIIKLSKKIEVTCINDQPIVVSPPNVPPAPCDLVALSGTTIHYRTVVGFRVPSGLWHGIFGCTERMIAKCGLYVPNVSILGHPPRFGFAESPFDRRHPPFAEDFRFRSVAST